MLLFILLGIVFFIINIFIVIFPKSEKLKKYDKSIAIGNVVMSVVLFLTGIGFIVFKSIGKLFQ